MKGILGLILGITMSACLFGQDVQVVHENAVEPRQNVKAFDLIDNSASLSEKQSIATLKGFSTNSGKHTLATMFTSFWGKSNSLGANSFLIDSVYSSQDTLCVLVTVYYLDEHEMKRNLESYPKNMVYVIGDIDKRQTSKIIKFNNQKIELKPMGYISYQNKVGEEAIISIGGLTGAKTWVKGEEGKVPKHLSVSGFGVGPGIGPVYPSTVGLSFNTGRIYPVDLNFGQFLIQVLKNGEVKFGSGIKH